MKFNIIHTHTHTHTHTHKHKRTHTHTLLLTDDATDRPFLLPLGPGAVCDAGHGSCGFFNSPLPSAQPSPFPSDTMLMLHRQVISISAHKMMSLWAVGGEYV